MSNRGGRGHKHCLVGMKRKKSTQSHRKNKAKARERKAEKMEAFKKLTAGV